MVRWAHDAPAHQMARGHLPSGRSREGVHPVPQLAEYIVVCPQCNTRTVCIPITRLIDEEDVSPWDGFFVVVQCRICYRYMLIQHDADDKDSYRFRKSNELLWPSSGREMSSKVPESLRLENKEARTCFRNGAYTATVVMVRRTLEGVCAENGVKKQPLIKALQQMAADGLIEGRLLEWAQELRVLGNEGAHFTGNRVLREDAQDALALAEALLDYLYVFSAQFAEFKTRRGQRDQENPDTDTDDNAS
jgi:hypothetical protein